MLSTRLQIARPARHGRDSAARTRWVVALATSALLACGSCSSEHSPDAPSKQGVSLSRAACDDAIRAIESYIAANRTREAEIIARKLLTQVSAGTDTIDTAMLRQVEEYAARAFFARAELARSELPARERQRLVEEAAQCAARAAQPPATVETYRFAAMLLDRAGNRAQAATLYEAALALAPDDAATLLPAALAALGADAKSTTARDYAERHARVAPNAAWTSALRAEIALADLNPNAAVVAAEEAVARDRDMLEMRVVLAKSLRAAGRATDAARMLSALDAQDRAKAAIATQLAVALQESGDFPRAAAAWRDAVKADPTDAFLRAECALAWQRAGDTAAAAAELAALDALPDGFLQRARIDPLLREASQRSARPPSR